MQGALALGDGLADVAAQPPRATLRATAALLVAGVAMLLGWTAMAELDIVAVAPGRLVPLTQVKPVQAPEAGLVTELLVGEGERVAAGDVLLRLDATVTRADSAAVEADVQLKRVVARAIDAELAGTELGAVAGVPRVLLDQVRAQFVARRRAVDDAIAQEREAAQRTRHELAAARKQWDKLQQTLPTYRQAAQSFARLRDEGFVGELLASEKERDLIEREQDLASQAATLDALAAAIAQAEQRQQQLRSNYVADLQRERTEAQAALHRLEQELAKAAFRTRQLDVVSPQDGVVKDLVVRAAGHVLQAGAAVLRIVPDGDRLVAEAMLANEDVGFVEVGQRARVKVVAYPFQRYGLMEGQVAQISADAMEDTDRATVARAAAGYRALIELDAQRLAVAGGPVLDLTTGMAATVEIHQGRRTVLEYLTSPVRRVVSEVGRER